MNPFKHVIESLNLIKVYTANRETIDRIDELVKYMKSVMVPTIEESFNEIELKIIMEIKCSEGRMKIHLLHFNRELWNRFLELQKKWQKVMQIE